jgi:hypothetical protein
MVREFSSWYLQQFESAYLGDDEETRVWVRMQGELLKIRGYCDGLGIDFHLVVFPILYELDRYRFHDVEAEIEGFARRNGIPVYSLTPGFLGQDASTLWVTRSDHHPNEQAHRLAAERLYPYVRDQVLRTLD